MGNYDWHGWRPGFCAWHVYVPDSGMAAVSHWDHRISSWLFDFMKKNKILSPIAINLLLDELYEQYGLVLKVKPKIKSHVQKYLSGLTDINYFVDNDDQDVIYYNVGTISKNMNMSIAKASHIWQLQPNIKLNKRVFATIETENILKFLQMMMVNFVRFHQLTVIPFPVKYLREFIQLEEKKKSAKKDVTDLLK